MPSPRRGTLFNLDRHHTILQPRLLVHKRGRRPFKDQLPIITRPGPVVMPMSAQHKPKIFSKNLYTLLTYTLLCGII